MRLTFLGLALLVIAGGAQATVQRDMGGLGPGGSFSAGEVASQTGSDPSFRTNAEISGVENAAARNRMARKQARAARRHRRGADVTPAVQAPTPPQ